MIIYIALFSALLSRLTALTCGSTWVTSFIAHFLNIHRSGVLTALACTGQTHLQWVLILSWVCTSLPRGSEKVPHFALPWGQTDINGFAWLKVWFRTIRPSLLPHKFQLLSSSSSSLCSPLSWIGTYSKFKKFRQEFQLKIKEDYVTVFLLQKKSDISPHD